MRLDRFMPIKTDNTWWEVTKDRIAFVKRSHIETNGELYYQGYWIDNETTFDLPAALFEESQIKLEL